ncbi:MAG: DUF1810 domain-containing protein [Anaerolineaceae bacterium]|nr:DUF1810 domain-containing protein [Anaerolineaceae bacterium]
MAELDRFNLQRFITAQEPVFAEVVAELRAGRKRTHWMWFVFPQVAGLGFSPTSQFYAVGSVEEARAFLDHPVLGRRLRQCVAILLAGEDSSALAIFGQPDTMKLQSSLTLFAGISVAGSVFDQALDKFFKGERCQVTQAFLAHS